MADLTLDMATKMDIADQESLECIMVMVLGSRACIMEITVNTANQEQGIRTSRPAIILVANMARLVQVRDGSSMPRK